MDGPLFRKNYVVDQGAGWRGQRRWIAGGVGVNFACAAATLDLRVDPDSALPTITVNLVPTPGVGLVGLDAFGNYWWDIFPPALAALTPVQRALYFCFRVFWFDGHRDDLLEGRLFQRRNLVIP